MSDTRTIHQRIAAVMRQVGAIGKDHQVKFGKTNYNYRGIADVYNRVQPLFAEHGVFCTSKVAESSILEGQTKHGHF